MELSQNNTRFAFNPQVGRSRGDLASRCPSRISRSLRIAHRRPTGQKSGFRDLVRIFPAELRPETATGTATQVRVHFTVFPLLRGIRPFRREKRSGELVSAARGRKKGRRFVEKIAWRGLRQDL